MTSLNIDDLILPRVSGDKSSQRPFRRNEVVHLEQNISHLQVARKMVPFRESADDINVFATPPFPEMLDNHLRSEINRYEADGSGKASNGLPTSK